MYKQVRTAFPFILSALFICIALSLYYVRLAGMQHLIVVHFNAGRGADVLGTAHDVLAMINGGTLMLIINLILASILYARNRALSQTIGIITVLITLLILGTLLGIIALI